MNAPVYTEAEEKQFLEGVVGQRIARAEFDKGKGYVFALDNGLEVRIAGTAVWYEKKA